jgi:hypothetical protein
LRVIMIRIVKMAKRTFFAMNEGKPIVAPL